MKTWQLLTIYGHHHPKADIDRLYVPREHGGSDLMHLDEAYTVEITKPLEYADTKHYLLIQIARTHKHINSAVLQTARRLKTELQRGTRQINDNVAEKTKERWLGKRMLGQFSRDLDEKLVDNEQSYRWLKFGDIRGETKCKSGSSRPSN
jgi:hypothetical protein